MVDIEVYQHYQRTIIPPSLALSKNNCAVISASVASIIEIVLKISLSNADTENLLKTENLSYNNFVAIDFKVDPMPEYLLIQYIFV